MLPHNIVLSAKIFRNVYFLTRRYGDADSLLLPMGGKDVLPVAGADHPSFHGRFRNLPLRITVVIPNSVYRSYGVVKIVLEDVFRASVNGALPADGAGITVLSDRKSTRLNS